LLSNLETSREKLIQILLLGQPELDRKLDERGLRQLRQRISVRWKLSPLAATETRAYVRHRLSVAAGEPKGIFSDAALREVHRRTGGIPRLVNQLCDRALLGGYAARADKIGPSLVRAAAKEIPDARRPHERVDADKPTRPWLFFAAMCGLVAIGLIAGLQVGRSGLTDAMQSSLFNRSRTQAVADRIATETDLASGSAPPVVAAPPPTLARLIGPVSAGAPVPPAAAARSGNARVTALASGLLPELLAAQNPIEALGTTQHVLLERFGRRTSTLESAPRRAEDLKANLESRGLEATAFEGGSLALLRRLDHPVALALRAEEARPAASPLRWVAVVGFESDRVRVAGLMPDREVTIRIEEFESHWSETGIVVWERFERIPEILSHNDEGGGVVWLQRALNELEFHVAPPTGQYDLATLDAVKRFQSERGLIADGVTGPLTQIALFGRLERYPVPRLSDESTTESPPTSLPTSSMGGGSGGGERG
jgi:general secretion pathway protein A